MAAENLSHIDSEGNANMVDVSHKEITLRIAKASGKVIFPASVFDQLTEQNFLGKKGSIIQTAVIAGIQAAKKTSELIPLCHPLALKDIQIEISSDTNNHSLEILAMVKCQGQTGVEMEALTATSVAALTIYDMTKAMSHDILITDIELKEKSGGKHTIKK